MSSDRVPLETFGSDSLAAEMDAHWRGLCPEDGIPLREDIDPLELPRRLLPWMLLVTVVRDGRKLDYFYRLAGTSVVGMIGFDPTGRLASEIYGPDSIRAVTGAFDATVEEAQPTFWIGRVPHERIESVRIERAFFPLARDGRTVDMLIGVSVPAAAEDRPDPAN